MNAKPYVALLIDIDTSYGRGVARGIIEYSHAHGPWRFYVHGGRPVIPLEEVDGWDGDGLIAFALSAERRSAMRQKDVPVVNTSSEGKDAAIPTVCSDNAAIGVMGATHFLERGFYHFGYCGRGGFAWSGERGDAFGDTVAAAGFECAQFQPEGSPRDMVEEEAPITEWLASLPKPAGVMTCNDMRGRQVIEICRRRDIPVPEHIAVLGTDNDDLMCEMSLPHLSSVVQSTRRIGYLAARMLAEMMEGGAAPASPVLVPPERIETRQSTDALAIADPDVVKALHFIRAHAAEPIDVADVLNDVHVSRRTLERLFRRELGRSPAEEICRAHVERAKTLLIKTELTVYQTAEAAGFTSVKHLHQVFKRLTHTTPGAFRAQFRNTA